MTALPSWRATLSEVASRLPDQDGRRSARALTHGSMTVRLYAPRGHDPQVPHRQDEIYVVVAGSGVFENAGARTPFGPGDVLFAAAGAVHRFVDFTSDFQTWVVFYGPDDGEAADAAPPSTALVRG